MKLENWGGFRVTRNWLGSSVDRNWLAASVRVKASWVPVSWYFSANP